MYENLSEGGSDCGSYHRITETGERYEEFDSTLGMSVGIGDFFICREHALEMGGDDYAVRMSAVEPITAHVDRDISSSEWIVYRFVLACDKNWTDENPIYPSAALDFAGEDGELY